jgi:hypothetical protein
MMRDDADGSVGVDLGTGSGADRHRLGYREIGPGAFHAISASIGNYSTLGPYAPAVNIS